MVSCAVVGAVIIQPSFWLEHLKCVSGRTLKDRVQNICVDKAIVILANFEESDQLPEGPPSFALFASVAKHGNRVRKRYINAAIDKSAA